MGLYLFASIICLILGCVFINIANEKHDGEGGELGYAILSVIFLSCFLIFQLLAAQTHLETITAEQYLLSPQDYNVDKVYRNSVVIEYKVSKKE